MTIATTHEVTIVGDLVRKRFVTAERDEADREWLGLTTMDTLTPGLAPQPLSRRVEDGIAVIEMTRLPGASLGPEPVSPTQLTAVVAAYRTMFAAQVPPELPYRRAGDDELRPALLGWAASDYELDACQETGLVARALAAARTHVARGAETPQPPEPVLSLGDGNLANLIWDGECCRFVDFEDFGRSELTYEIADLVEHAASRLSGALPVQRAIEAFALTPAQTARLTEHRRLFACFWLVMLLPGNPGFTRNPAGSVEDQSRHLLDLLEGPTR